MTALQRQVPLGEQVADRLRTQIVRGDLAPGSRLVEETIAAEFGVSRGPAREAIHRLATEGLIDDSRPRNANVIGLDADDVEQLYSLREALEVLALRRARERGSEKAWSEMDEMVQRMKKAAAAGDAEAFCDADLEYHNHLYAMADHPRLHAVWSQYRPTFADLLAVTMTLSSTAPADDHALLLHAMRGPDGAAAVKALREHLESAHRHMADAIAGRR